MKEIIAPDGQMCVHRRLQQVAYIIQAPDIEASDWELLPEDDALSLEQEWHPSQDPPMTDNQPKSYDSERTSGEA
ncbi:hypothetical protein [uncultured Porphyromonas sp.]|uniref:hypothetical protein n=1 Tax=uncultured Porphyromonas sp. TaxID=159274 RepID=UPI00261BC3F7|nr:hypothetical protein [uncultured Porphyromonas sp.]